MPLESNVNNLDDLNELWPLGTDPKSEGDDHLRNVKVAAKASDTDRKGEIDALDARVASAESDIATNTSVNSTQNGRLSSLESSVSDLEAFENRITNDTRIIHGRVNAGGARISGTGFTSSRVSEGRYRLTFNYNPGGNNDWSLVAQCKAEIPLRFASIEYTSDTVAEVFTNKADGAVTDTEFSFIRLCSL